MKPLGDTPEETTVASFSRLKAFRSHKAIFCTTEDRHLIKSSGKSSTGRNVVFMPIPFRFQTKSSTQKREKKFIYHQPSEVLFLKQMV